jgi:polyisoprenoid-binding protein YceI
VKAWWVLQTVRGVFGACDGRLKVRAGDAAGELTIDASRLDTGHNRRDRRLRSPDFFDVEPHPQIVFSATAVTARDGGLAVTGELTIGSSRVRLEIPVNVEHMADGLLRLKGKRTVSRQAAGVTWNKLGMIGDDAMLHAQLTFSAQPDNAARHAGRVDRVDQDQVGPSLPPQPVRWCTMSAR